MTRDARLGTGKGFRERCVCKTFVKSPNPYFQIPINCGGSREMWFGGGGGGGRGVAAGLFVRYFSRKCAVNVRKINPKVPYQEASSIAQSLYQVIKQNGALSISNTWIQAKVFAISFSSMNSSLYAYSLTLYSHPWPQNWRACWNFLKT